MSRLLELEQLACNACCCCDAPLRGCQGRGDVPALYQSRPRGGRRKGLRLCSPANTGRIRGWIALPAAAYPAPEKGCLPPLPWTPSGPRWHGDRCADRLCCQPREGAWVRRHAHCPHPFCQAPGAAWRLPSPRTHVHVAGPIPRSEGPSHGRPKCRTDTAAGAPALAAEADCPDAAAAAAAAPTHHCVGPSPVRERAARWQA